MPVTFQELRAQCRAALGWVIALVALAALMLSLYPSMARDVADYRRLMEAYPPAVRAMLGIRLDRVATLPGFYSMVFSFVALCGAIQAMNLGMSLLGREARGRTADFLLTKPLARTRIVTAKLLAAFAVLLGTNLVFDGAVSAIAHAAAPAGFDSRLFLLINLSLFWLQLIFLALGLTVSAVFLRLRSVLPVSIGTVFAIYMIGVLAPTSGRGSGARWLSPFHWFDTGFLLDHGRYDPAGVAAAAAVTAAAVLAAYLVYRRRDIRAD